MFNNIYDTIVPFSVNALSGTIVSLMHTKFIA